MSEHTRANHMTYGLLPTAIEGFDSRGELALDLRWSWNHYGDRVWRELDPELWDLTQNPWVVLQAVSPGHLQALLADTDFRREVNEFLELKRRRVGISAGSVARVRLESVKMALRSRTRAGSMRCAIRRQNRSWRQA